MDEQKLIRIGLIILNILLVCILVIVLTISSLGLVSAGLQIGQDDSVLGINFKPIEPINYSTIVTNSSDFWGSYLYSDYNMPSILSYAYNHTAGTFDIWGNYWYNYTLTLLEQSELNSTIDLRRDVVNVVFSNETDLNTTIAQNRDVTNVCFLNESQIATGHYNLTGSVGVGNNLKQNSYYPFMVSSTTPSTGIVLVNSQGYVEDDGVSGFVIDFSKGTGVNSSAVNFFNYESGGFHFFNGSGSEELLSMDKTGKATFIGGQVAGATGEMYAPTFRTANTGSYVFATSLTSGMFANDSENAYGYDFRIGGVPKIYIGNSIHVDDVINATADIITTANITAVVYHGVIDWINVPISATLTGTTACTNLNNLVAGYSYQCQTCVDSLLGTQIACGTIASVMENCACKVL